MSDGGGAFEIGDAGVGNDQLVGDMVGHKSEAATQNDGNLRRFAVAQTLAQICYGFVYLVYHSPKYFCYIGSDEAICFLTG